MYLFYIITGVDLLFIVGDTKRSVIIWLPLNPLCIHALLPLALGDSACPLPICIVSAFYQGLGDKSDVVFCGENEMSINTNPRFLLCPTGQPDGVREFFCFQVFGFLDDSLWVFAYQTAEVSAIDHSVHY